MKTKAFAGSSIFELEEQIQKFFVEKWENRHDIVSISISCCLFKSDGVHHYAIVVYKTK